MTSLSLAALQSFYVGGRTREITGAFGPEKQSFGAMYVRRLVPTSRSFPLPVIFLHGGMHTGVTWETTPDGRDGWENLFVAAGFETLVVDQASRGRSAPDLNGLNPAVAAHDTPPGPVFTCGSALARQFERGGGRFDLDALDDYLPQLWPDFFVPTAIAAGQPGLSDPIALPPLIDLLDRLGCAVLVTHSQGGHLGWCAALARPNNVAAIYAIEPALISPGLAQSDFPDIPVRVVWGDNLADDARTLNTRDVTDAKAIAERRSSVTVDHLPEHGIHGNGHMLMMEDNSALLADRAMAWLHEVLA